MASKSVEKAIEEMRAGNEVTFAELKNVCTHYFGKARTKGSHHIFSMPWAGDPRINIQNEKGKAKRYQVRQVLAALDRLADMVLEQRKAEAAVQEKAEEKSKKKKK